MRAVLGRMRMSLADFESLTVPELIMLYRSWGDEVAGEMRQRWEVMRLQVCALLQPWVNKKLDPLSFIPFPRDGTGTSGSHRSSALSSAGQKARFDFYREHGVWPETSVETSVHL